MVDIVSAAPAGIASEAWLATGVFVGSGNAASLVLGFNPRYCEIVNETDNIIWEKMQGSAPNTSYKSTAGTETIDTTSAITFPADVGLNEPGSTVLLSAALCAAGKRIVFAVWG